MPFTTVHYYLTFGGPTYGGQEEWQTGAKFAPYASFQGTDPALLLDQLDNISITDILQDVTELISQDSEVHWGNAVAVSWAKLAVLKVDGKYAGDPILAEQAPVTGGYGAFGYAPQLAAVVSAWSGSNLGRANHGRAYLPVPHSWMTTTTVLEPRVSLAAAQGLRNGWGRMITKVHGEIDTVAVPTKYSIMSKLDAGTTKEVKSIGCGRVIDTMRSRRGHLDDEPEFVAWGPALADGDTALEFGPTKRRAR